MRGAEAFLHLPPPVLQVNRLFEETGILRSKPHPQASNRVLQKNHSNMAGRRSSSSRSLRSKPGDWEECSLHHNRLIELQTQGFLPPTFMVPVRAGIANYNGGEQAERSPNPSPEERICLMPHLLRGRRVSYSSIPSRAPGVLWPPVAQLYPSLRTTYSRVCRPL